MSEIHKHRFKNSQFKKVGQNVLSSVKMSNILKTNTSEENDMQDVLSGYLLLLSMCSVKENLIH